MDPKLGRVTGISVFSVVYIPAASISPGNLRESENPANEAADPISSGIWGDFLMGRRRREFRALPGGIRHIIGKQQM